MMTLDIAWLLEDLDGHPTTQLTMHGEGGDIEYRQVLCWYWDVRKDGRVLKRGTQTEPRTNVEIEDLLTEVERNTKNV